MVEALPTLGHELADRGNLKARTLRDAASTLVARVPTKLLPKSVDILYYACHA